MEYCKVFLKPKKEESLLRFHPWVFSGAIQSVEGDPEEGDLVRYTERTSVFWRSAITKSAVSPYVCYLSPQSPSTMLFGLNVSVSLTNSERPAAGWGRK